MASACAFANVANKQNTLSIQDLYARAETNLRRRDPRYPTARRLRSITWQGRSGAWGWPSAGSTGKPLGEILGTVGCGPV